MKSQFKLFIFVLLALVCSVVSGIAISYRPESDSVIKKVNAQEHFSAGRSFAPLFSSLPTATPTPINGNPHQGYCLYVPVIMYHHVQPESVAISHGQTGLTVDPSYFDQQMNYIVTQGYTAVSAEALVLALRNHTVLPGKSIVITLDDGYEDNYQYAYPILQKYHLLGNFMVATGLLGGVGNNTYYTWDQLKQMVDSGTVYPTDHTWSHYPMGTGTPAKDQMEIMTAKQELESHLGKSIDIFTYPYGTGYNNPRVAKELESDGFLGAYSTVGGVWQCDSYIYGLRRIHIGNAPLSSYGL